MRTFIVYFFAALILSSCSLKDPPQQKNTIRITLPNFSGASPSPSPTITLSTHGRSSLSAQSVSTQPIPQPSSIASFNCFGVRVSGSGIFDNQTECGEPKGISVGTLGIGQGYIDLDVPVGMGRSVEVFGIQSSSGCPSIQDVLNPQFRENEQTSIGSIYQIGKASVDIQDNTTVTVKVSYNSSSSKKMFVGCDFVPLWKEVPTSYAARYSQVNVWTGSDILIWGGQNESGFASQGFSFNPVGNLTMPISTASQPSDRANAVGFFNNLSNSMVIWGGSSGSSVLNDGGIYNRSLDQWSTIAATGAPSLRDQFSAVWDGDQMYIWGGYYNTSALSDGAIFSSTTNTWSPISTTNAPSPRYHHGAVFSGSGEMIVWGGITLSSGPHALGSGARYNPSNSTWTTMTNISAPSPRYDMVMNWVGNKLVIWGGKDDIGNELGDGAVYDPSSDTWTTINSQGALSPRSSAYAVTIVDKVLIYGGGSRTDGAYFDPTSNTWTPIQKSFVHYRENTSAVWAITSMVLFGGTDETNTSSNKALIFTPN